jgi:O-succinylbenzoate synthase
MNKLGIKRLELREISLRLKSPFETSFGKAFERRILIVTAFDIDGCVGYGECTAPGAPFFNHETIDTAWAVISGFIAPMLASACPANAGEVRGILSAIKGNRMAIGGVEAAIWDLEAKKAGIPLWRHLGGTRKEIECGVSIGLQESPEILVEKVTDEVESGYQRIKLKIKPGQDFEFVKAVRSRFPDIRLSVDANSAYELERDTKLFEQLDEFGLLMFEQPLSAGDLIDHAKLQKRIKTPICLDESIACFRDARHAIEIDACRIINIKLGRVGGHAEAIAIQEYASQHDIPVWCGGMLESGIGRAHNIAMSTLPGFSLPGDVSASARYWAEDVIEPEVTVSPQGTISAMEKPGIGYEVKESFIEELVVKRDSFSLLGSDIKAIAS